ncbi:MAG: hypothetical protein ACTSW4_01740 [Candidatus Ranarchaeia archaeon]
MTDMLNRKRRLNAARRPIRGDIAPRKYTPDLVFSARVKDKAKEFGAALVGIAPSTGWPVKHGHHPNEFLPRATSVVTVAIPETQTFQQLAPNRTRTYFTTIMYHKLSEIIYHLSLWLEEQGFRAYPIPSDENVATIELLRKFHHEFSDVRMGDISLVHAAVFSGLAIRGKSGMAITPRYGPRVRFAAVITDAPLKHDERLKHDICQDCTVCQKVCIGGAITEHGYDPVRCLMMEGITGKPNMYYPFNMCDAPCVTRCPAGRGWPPRNRKPVPYVDRPIDV